MSKFKVTVQYPYTVWYSKEVEVDAKNEADASVAAIQKADDDGWDDATRRSDGECGDTTVWEIEPADPL